LNILPSRGDVLFPSVCEIKDNPKSQLLDEIGHLFLVYFPI